MVAKIVVLWRSEDALSTPYLVSRCSGILESINIADLRRVPFDCHA